MIRDVTGFTLGEAISLLEAAGVKDINVKLTAPPRERDLRHGPESRVVRQLVRETAGGMEVELVVCNL